MDVAAASSVSQQNLTGTAEEKVDKDRQDALELLIDIELDLTAFRNRLYQEKKEELEREAKLVKDGSHPALIPLLQQIEAKHEEQIKFATATLDRKEQSFHDELQSAIDAANLEYKRKKARIRHEMVAECVQQRIQLQEEYRKFYQSSIRDRTVTSKRRKTKKLECLEWEMMLEDDYFPSSVVNGLSGPKISEDLDLFQL